MSRSGRRPSSRILAQRRRQPRALACACSLTARVSNRSALGAKIEMRAGSLRQRLETYAATPAPAPADIVFGLGDRAGADVVRVLWPSGILQAEAAAIAPQAHALDRLVKSRSSIASRRPARSCSRGTATLRVRDRLPRRRRDGLLGGARAAQHAGPRRVRADPRRPAAAARRPLELRVTNELEEALFLDRAQLVAVAHPRGTEVYPNEGLRPPPEPFRLLHDAGDPSARRGDRRARARRRRSAAQRRPPFPDDFARNPSAAMPPNTA